MLKLLSMQQLKNGNSLTEYQKDLMDFVYMTNGYSDSVKNGYVSIILNIGIPSEIRKIIEIGHNEKDANRSIFILGFTYAILTVYDSIQDGKDVPKRIVADTVEWVRHFPFEPSKKMDKVISLECEACAKYAPHIFFDLYSAIIGICKSKSKLSSIYKRFVGLVSVNEKKDSEDTPVPQYKMGFSDDDEDETESLDETINHFKGYKEKYDLRKIGIEDAVNLEDDDIEGVECK